MNQGGVNSSIQIKNLKNAFSFHIKCGEIYYLQPVNEVLIICNICNNENFDKYENFLQHFSICYKKSTQKDINVDDFVNGGSQHSMFKKELEHHIMDIAPLQLSESDDDDEDDENDESGKNKNGGKTIPTIEIDDSETDSDDSSEDSLREKMTVEETINAIRENLKENSNKNSISKNVVDFNVIKQMQNATQQATVPPTNSVKNELPGKTINLPQFSENKAESEKANQENVEKQGTSKIISETQKPSVEIPESSKKISENKTSQLDIVSQLNPAASFQLLGILPQIAALGEYNIPLLSNYPNMQKPINPKYVKSKQRPHECPECGKCFAQRINLVTHFRTHTGEKPYKCNMCDNAYPQKSNLDAHMLKHTGIRPYGCEDCGKRFFQLSHLLAHERTHSGERPYKCGDCDRSFSQSSHLTMHSRNTHNNEHLFKCNMCSSYFTDQNLLSAHQLTHINETLLKFKDFGSSNEVSGGTVSELVPSLKQYISNQQNRLIDNPNKLNVENNKTSNEINRESKNNGLLNQQQHQEQQSQSDISQQTLLQQEELQQQQQIQKQLQQQQQFNSKVSPNKDSQDDQAKRFECEYCHKKFYQSNHLAMHQRSHSGHKIKSDSPTKLKFKFKQNTLGLKRRHECDDCGKKFALVTELKVHQKKKH